MIHTPLASPLPRQIDPRKFAQQGIHVDGSIALKELSRLSELLFSQEGSVNAKLEFGIGEQRILNVKGSIEANVENICQRCLGAVSVPVSCEISLAILWKEEDAERLPKRFDPWIIGEGITDIYQIIEDELLLSLPIVSYHEEECVPNAYFSAGEKETSQLIEKAAVDTNPFQVLEQLKSSLQSPTDRDSALNNASEDDN